MKFENCFLNFPPNGYCCLVDLVPFQVLHTRLRMMRWNKGSFVFELERSEWPFKRFKLPVEKVMPIAKKT